MTKADEKNRREPHDQTPSSAGMSPRGHWHTKPCSDFHRLPPFLGRNVTLPSQASQGEVVVPRSSASSEKRASPYPEHPV